MSVAPMPVEADLNRGGDDSVDNLVHTIDLAAGDAGWSGQGAAGVGSTGARSASTAQTSFVKLSELPNNLAHKLQRFDKDNNGTLDLVELSDALKQANLFREEQNISSGNIPISAFPNALQEKLKELDSSGDGNLEFDDIVRGFTTLQTLSRGSIPFETFPDEVQQKLKKFDDTGDNCLDSGEIVQAFDALEAQIQASKKGIVPFSSFPPHVQKELRELDDTGDEQLDAQEILKGIQALTRERHKSRQLMWLSAGLLIFSLVLLAAMGGLMFEVIQMTKESKVADSGKMTVKGSDVAIQVASSDTVVVDGVLEVRSGDTSTGRRSCTNNGTCASSNSIKTAQAFVGSALSSTLDDEDLKELRSLTITQGESWIHFTIDAVARYAEFDSRYGTVVVLYTPVGQLTLDGESIAYEEKVEGAFARAGFVVSGRRLLGIVEVLGLFNTIRRAAEVDPSGELEEAIADIPEEFFSEVQKITYCSGGGDCRNPEDEEVDHALQQSNGEMAIVADEEQHLMIKDGKFVARTQVTKPQFPDQTYTKLRNETHLLTYQTYNGVHYYCEITKNTQLAAVTQKQAIRRKHLSMRRQGILGLFDRRQGSPAPGDDDKPPMEYVTVYKGDELVEGTLCRFFQITATINGRTMVIDIWESHSEKRIFQMGVANQVHRFKSMKAIDDSNSLTLQDLDFEGIMAACDPVGIIAPTPWIEGEASDIVHPEYDWGMVEDPEHDIYANFSQDYLAMNGTNITGQTRRLMEISDHYLGPFDDGSHPLAVREISLEQFYAEHKEPVPMSPEEYQTHLSAGTLQTELQARRFDNWGDDWPNCHALKKDIKTGQVTVTLEIVVECLNPSKKVYHQVKVTPDLGKATCPATKGEAVYKETTSSLTIAGKLTYEIDVKDCISSKLPGILRKGLDWIGFKLIAGVEIGAQYDSGNKISENSCSRGYNQQIGDIKWTPEFYGKGYLEGELEFTGLDIEFGGALQFNVNPLIACSRLQHKNTPPKVGVGADLKVYAEFDFSWWVPLPDFEVDFGFNVFPAILVGNNCQEKYGIYRYRSRKNQLMGYFDLPIGQCVCPYKHWGGSSGWWSRCRYG